MICKIPLQCNLLNRISKNIGRKGITCLVNSTEESGLTMKAGILSLLSLWQSILPTKWSRLLASAMFSMLFVASGEIQSNLQRNVDFA